MDYEKLKIKSYKHWDLYLHDSQCYLGRTFLKLKNDKDKEDFIDISQDEREEFFLISQSVKKALKALFNPDKMNYAALSNTSPVIHVHLIPRYKESRTFQNHTFTDTRWGKNYAPYNKSYSLNEETLFAIRDALSKKLSQESRFS